MSNAYEIYVISNGDLFREGLNAVAAFCSSPAFKDMMYLGGLLGILFTAMAYLKKHEVMLFLKWFVIYFFVFNVLLGVKQSVAIINTSDPSNTGRVVDGVPIGIALPAHLITKIAHQFGRNLEKAFHQPDSLQYNKTGMLFGSNLFRLSLSANLEDVKTMNTMNAYMRSCVLGDVLINHKYTFNKLLQSKNLWGLMTSQPSKIRGIFIDGVFKNCAETSTYLTNKLNIYSEKKAPSLLAKWLPAHQVYAVTALNQYLKESYLSLTGLAKSANEILQQNIAINAFRSGIKNYAAETGSVAGMENMANTMAMLNTRMAWSTSSHLGIQTLPLMQVVLLLMMLCVFPLIAILAMMPGFGLSVLKNYFYTLIWLESWPILFTVLNLAMTFYLKPGANEKLHVTLANINRLALEHSDVASIAGYLVLAIPFLSIGLVKGMAMTFNQAAQYLGGMMHSIGQSASSSVAMGNYSVGNVSTANATANTLNANKHDSNFTDFQGMSTEQLSNATTLTTTPSGSVISQVGGGLSQLATSLNVSQSLSASLAKSADSYKASSETERHSYENALSSAATNAMAFDVQNAKGQSLSDSATQGSNAGVDQAISNMQNLTAEVAKREHCSENDAYKTLSQAAFNESGGFDTSKSFWGKAVSFTVGGSLKAGTSETQQGSSEHLESYQQGHDISVNGREVDEFRKNSHIVENYSLTHAAQNNQSHSAQLATKIGDDLRRAESALHSSVADFAKGERLSEQASYVKTHSEAVQSNFNQAFADYVRQVDPSHANQILNNTTSVGIAMQRQALAEQFLHQYETHFEKSITNQVNHADPNASYQAASSSIETRSQAIKQHYHANANRTQGSSTDAVGNYDQVQHSNIFHDVESQQKSITNTLSKGKYIEAQIKKDENASQKAMQQAEHKDKQGLAKHWVSSE